MKLQFKKIIYIIFILTIIPSLSFSHSGRTDSKGGHWNRSTGKYHYHHGYPAHNHTNGICPYSFNPNSYKKSNSGTIKQNISYTTDIYNTKQNTNFSPTPSHNISFPIPVFIGITIIFLILFITYLKEKNSEQHK